MIKLAENDNFILEHDVSNEIYRVSYFEDNHFKDEFVFAISHVKEPVRHGKWENYPSHAYRRCSLCKKEWEKPKFNVRANYCPNCGAKMED